jgi:hypothetical protein
MNDEKSKGLKLNKTLAKPDLSVNNYCDLYVGLELESSGLDTTETAKHFDVKAGCKGKMVKPINISGANFKGKVDVEVDLYKEDNIVTDVYTDASVGCEIVTRPVRLKDMDRLVKPIHDYIIANNGNCFAAGRGGLHMTFCLDTRKTLSCFDRIVVQNLVQLTRAYYKEIIVEFAENNTARSLHFCALPTVDQRNSPGYDGKYCAINVRRDDYGNIWGIEIRLPSGTNDWNLIIRQLKFWSAMIRHAAIISKFGLIEFDQDVFDKQKEFYNIHSSTYSKSFKVRKPKSKKPCENRMYELYKIISSSLSFYSYEKEEVEQSERELRNKVFEFYLEGKSFIEIFKEIYHNKRFTSTEKDKLKKMIDDVNGGN